MKKTNTLSVKRIRTAYALRQALTAVCSAQTDLYKERIRISNTGTREDKDRIDAEIRIMDVEIRNLRSAIFAFSQRRAFDTEGLKGNIFA